MATDVFVSYASVDRPKVVALAERLRRAGVSSWVDQESIPGASLWAQEIVEAIERCRVLILAASRASFESPNVLREVTIASERRKPILPLYLERVPLPSRLAFPLAGIQHIDLFEHPLEQALPRILSALRGHDVRADEAPDLAGYSALPVPPCHVRRAGLLDQAREWLRRAPFPVFAIQGLVGAGKTTLLAELLSDEAAHFRHVVVLPCDGPAAQEPSYALERLDDVLRLEGRALEPLALTSRPPERSLEILRSRLTLTDRPLLLVLDGLDTIDPAWPTTVMDVLAGAPGLQVVATARHRPSSRAVTQLLSVPPLTESEALTFVADYARFLGVDVDAAEVLRRLSPGLRTHPQALATLTAQLRDFPLDLLLAAGLPEEVRTPARLLEASIGGLPGSTRSVLAELRFLSGVDLLLALRVLGLPTTPELLRALQDLLGRSLLQRAGRGYVVPAIVGEALSAVDPSTSTAAAAKLADAWSRIADGPETTAALATVGAGMVHRLADAGHDDLLLGMLRPAFIDRLNREGAWKEYSLLMRLGFDAARRTERRDARIGLGFRLTRKLVQMRDGDGARATLAELSALVTSSETIERADLHSHQALVGQLEQDEERALRELQESARLRERLGDASGLVVVMNQIGNVHLRRRDVAEARHALNTAREGALVVGDDKQLIEADTSLALCEFAEGDLAGAQARLRSVLERCRQHGYAAGEPRAKLNLALVLEQRGELAEARRLVQEAVEESADGNVLVHRLASLVAGRLRGADRSGDGAIPR